MNWLKQIAIVLLKWRNPLLTIEVPKPFAGSNSPNFEPISKSPTCWCGHFARSHTKDGCQVYDCPCEKLMDPSEVICTKCLQVHPSGDPCLLPDSPPVVNGVSQGVLVNFKPAKKKDVNA